MRVFFPAIAVISFANSALAQEKPGDVFVIDVSHTSESKSETSSSSSRGGHEYRETVIAVEPNGVVREFDLPPNATEDDRLIAWHFPVRVLHSFDDRMTILNREAMIARRDRWLKEGGMTGEACGEWVFTWNAFKIECDPDAVLETLATLDIQPPVLAAQAMITHADAAAPAPLTLRSSDGTGAVYRAELSHDPAAFRKQRAETDIIVASIIGEKLTLEQALEKRADESPSGTITLEFEADPVGTVIRKTITTEVSIDGGADGLEVERSTVQIERFSLCENGSD